MFVRGDAISTSVDYKLRFLRRLAGTGAPVRPRLFTQYSDSEADDIEVVTSVHDLIRHPDFRATDIHIFEFGIKYDLFDALLVIPDQRAAIAVYHNITPPGLADTDALRRTLELSLLQKHNLSFADHVSCPSEFNRDDLIDFGIAPDRLSVLHLPSAVHPVPRPEPVGDHVRLLFVGRLVQAKGCTDLVQALVRLRSRGVRNVALTLAGNPSYSSAACLDDIRRIASEASLGEDLLRIVEFPDDRSLTALYSQSDALVIPSYHEGYCMPVIEALASGCYVITYDSTNLPHITGRLGTLVPTGDVDALTDAIAEFVDDERESRRAGTGGVRRTSGHGVLPMNEWRRAVIAHLDAHSWGEYERGLGGLITRVATAAGLPHDLGALVVSGEAA